jgi:hypothetical protein
VLPPKLEVIRPRFERKSRALWMTSDSVDHGSGAKEARRYRKFSRTIRSRGFVVHPYRAAYAAPLKPCRAAYAAPLKARRAAYAAPLKARRAG